MPKYSDYRDYESYCDKVNAERMKRYQRGLPSGGLPVSFGDYYTKPSFYDSLVLSYDLKTEDYM